MKVAMLMLLMTMIGLHYISLHQVGTTTSCDCLDRNKMQAELMQVIVQITFTIIPHIPGIAHIGFKLLVVQKFLRDVTVPAASCCKIWTQKINRDTAQ